MDRSTPTCHRITVRASDSGSATDNPISGMRPGYLPGSESAPLTQDEATWLEERTSALAAAGRARQRSQAERFEQRQREDAAAWRLLKAAAFVIVACLILMALAFAPIWWDLFHQHLGPAGMLLSVVAVPPSVIQRPFVGAVYCRHCDHLLPLKGPQRRISRLLIEEYSAGCLCRVDTDVLRGMLVGETSALESYRRFKRAWYKTVGVPEERADLYCGLVCRSPLPAEFAGLIIAEVERRAGPLPLSGLEYSDGGER
jgi:hypothetical protein